MSTHVRSSIYKKSDNALLHATLTMSAPNFLLLFLFIKPYPATIFVLKMLSAFCIIRCCIMHIIQVHFRLILSWNQTI